MSRAVDDLLPILDLEQLEINLFRGNSPQVGWQRVFGGQVIGQALVAACRTVDGDASRIRCTPISCSAATPRCRSSTRSTASATARSFTTRRVDRDPARPADLRHVGVLPRREPGFEHAVPMPLVPAPEELPSEARDEVAVLPMMPDPVRAYYERERPIELRPVEFQRYLAAEPMAPKFNVWIRATGRLPDDPAIHQCVLAYASDMTLLDASLVAHGRTVFERSIQPRASTTRCGFIARSGPTNGSSTPGQPERARRTRLFPRPDFCARRHAGRFGRARRPDPRARGPRLS